MTKNELELLHEQHRSRLRKQYLQNGADSLEEHNILELLLFYSIPRMNTNPLAHELIEKFGSLEGVLDADFNQLRAIPGVGEETALLIRLVTDIRRKSMSGQTGAHQFIASTQDAVDLLSGRFMGLKNELFLAAYLDGCSNLIQITVIDEGESDAVRVNVKKIVKTAVNCHAANVILAHSHPNGYVIPSYDDMVCTEKIMEALKSFRIGLCDHLIFSKDDWFSFAKSLKDKEKREKFGFSETGNG